MSDNSTAHKPRTVSSSVANAQLGELLTRAEDSGERTIVTRHGKPAAAIVPIADLNRLTASAA